MAGIVGLTELQHTNATSALTIDTSGNLTIKTGTTTIQGEGTATTNLQQGLTKAWYNLDAYNVTLRDSFNIGSITDEGTGEYEGNFTNAMNDGNYSAGGTCSTKGGTNSYSYIVTTGDQLNTYGLHSTAGIRTNCWAQNSSALADCDMLQVSVHGDLA